MIIKLIILGVIVTSGVVMFLPQTSILFPDSSTILTAVAQDVDDIKDDTLEQVEGQIDNTFETVDDKIDDITYIPSNIITNDESGKIYVGQVLENKENSCSISVPEMAKTINGKTELTHIITVQDCSFDQNEPVKVVERHARSSVAGIPIGNQQSSISVTPLSTSTFETLQLSTTKQENSDVQINYNDSTGQTLSVTITLKNSEKEIFTGQFFSSKFETVVNDITDTPYVIEMIVDHEVHGEIHSSVYNTGNDHTVINGIFTKSS